MTRAVRIISVVLSIINICRECMSYTLHRQINRKGTSADVVGVCHYVAGPEDRSELCANVFRDGREMLRGGDFEDHGFEIPENCPRILEE
jgi:hypothetical protein